MLVAVTNNQKTAPNNATATTSTTPIKMERRDSSSSLSSLDDLNNGRKKLNAITSTPVITSDVTTACDKNENMSHRSDIEGENQCMQESDEANDYDEEGSADEKSTSQPRQQLHCKRRRSSRSLSDKTASVLLEYNADNPNSLRKKFRFNRCIINNGDESGFVDASHSSQLINTSMPSLPANATNQTNSNNGSKSNSSSENSSPPQSNGNSSPESGIGEREDMKYMCPICDVVSQTAHQFTNHIRCHNYASGHTENFTCRICSKVLSSASSLDRHVLVHTGERPFNCKYCHLTFTTNGNMHRHMRTHKQHQHTHYRRNSSGTKFNTNKNNINNNSNNNTTTTTTMPAAVNKTAVNNVQLSEEVKLSTTTTTTIAVTTESTTTTKRDTLSSSAAPTLVDNGFSNNQKITPTAGANGKRLNNNNNIETDESDDGCSSDSSTDRVCSNNNNNNNCNNDNQNINNNDFKINNNNYKRKHEDTQNPQESTDSVKNNYNLLKRRLRLDTTTTTSISESAHTNNTHHINKLATESVVCSARNDGDLTDVLALDQHMYNKHPDLPAKCKKCDVSFRTHHQLSIHLCVVNVKESINLSFKQRRLSETSTHRTDDNHDETGEHTKQRHDLFQHFKNAIAHGDSSSSHYNQDLGEDDIKSEPSVHDSKDLADIQSILNMTASSNNSNLLRNFEQSVNTPSSQYSYDRDEEEAQDSFTAEFRKMKLLGEFPCKLCKAVYPNLRALKGHNRVHLSEAGPAGPFRCNMCPYLICDKAVLIRHMRTHNGDRPYECAVCNYAFTTKANCERHLRNRHAKTTRDEVKRAIIYHPSEDSSCDDTNKKLHMFSSELEDECDLMSYHQHQPKDRSTPVSHLKERLTSVESSSAKPVKIQVKNLEDLLDKSSAPSGYQDSHDEHNIESSQIPIDMSMDALDLSKKPSAPQPTVREEKIDTPIPLPLPMPLPLSLSLPKPDANFNNEILNNKTVSADADPKLDVSTLEKQHQQLLLAQQQLLNDPTQLMQQLYRNLLFPQFPPFFIPNSFMTNNLADFQKLAPFLTRIMSGVANNTSPTTDMEKPSTLTAQNPTTSITMNPLLSEKSNSPSLTSMSSPKSLLSPNTNHLSMPRHIMTSANSVHPPNLPPTILSNGPVKMVLKNGVFMPKQKQRRYRTERPFACEHCSARFTLRSNMERHVKQQHPQFYAQRQRSGHHVMRGRGASSTANMNSISHLQAAVAQVHYGSTPPPMNSHSPISDQVKYAILAQQLKARKDTDLLQQALAHGSNSVGNSNVFPQQGPNMNGKGQTTPFNFIPHHTQHLSQNGTPNGSMEDDEPKLVIDEDDEMEEDEEEMEETVYENDEHEDQDICVSENQKTNETKTEHLPTSVEEVKLNSGETQESVKKVAESILEQAIKSKKSVSLFTKKSESSTINSTNNTMKSMIAQAPAVGKFLKDVASSSFKDESQDLVSVSELVDNATNNTVSFNNYFRPSDVANHMEPSDEDGLVASSASESNNSGAEDTVSTEKPKKKSAYSLAPNRVHCPYCQRMFPWSSSLRRHILTHTGQKPFKCSHCPLLFTTKSNCDRHLLRKHGDVESAVSVYVPTEDVNEPIPLPKSVEEIERMQREREEEDRKRKAEEQRERLEKEQMEKQKLEQEQQQKQAFLNQLAANQFQQQFPQKSDSSLLSSSDLPFKCHLCESSFGERLQCLEHIKRLHAQDFALLLSKGAIENETDSTQITVNEDEERQRPHEDASKGGKYPDYSNRKVICAFCMRRFWSTEDLRRHMRTHSGERPFQCEICLRKFTLKHSMLRHMKKHNGHHVSGSQTNNDNLTNGNSCSDYSDDEQSTNNSLPPPILPLPSNNINALFMGSKFQELLNKTNEWRNGNNSLNIIREGKENNSEDTNTQQSSSDLIGNLLGISDQGILNKLMSSPDEAAKLLGVDK